jgi:AraC-like DNA-binding protein
MNFTPVTCTTPYTAEHATEHESFRGIRPAFGDVVLIRCAGPVAENGAELVENLVRQCRSSFPGSPVGVWIPAAEPDCVIELVRGAVSAQVRAIVGGPVIPAGEVRRQLTSLQGISPFVLRWAADAGYLPDTSLPDEVKTLLAAPPNVRTLERLAYQRQVASRTWRGKLQQMGLPTPRAWLGLAHALHVAFFLQRNRSRPLQALAEELGIPNVSVMSQQFRRVFGLAPGQVRELLGAEPLLQHWFRSQGRTPTQAQHG